MAFDESKCEAFLLPARQARPTPRPGELEPGHIAHQADVFDSQASQVEPPTIETSQTPRLSAAEIVRAAVMDTVIRN